MKKVSGFAVFDAKHCETAATKSLLLQEGFSISEPMMLGLSQGFGFIYWKMRFMNLPFIGGRSKPFELTKVFCENMGFELDERQTTSKKEKQQNVVRFIDGNSCRSATRLLPPRTLPARVRILRAFSDSLATIKPHAYVFDTGKTYKVSLENLEKARFEKGSMAAKARSYTLKKASVQPDIRPVIIKAIKEISRAFLNPPLKSFGYKGILTLSDDMKTWLDQATDSKKDLHDQAMLMEDGGTGGAIFRNFFQDFLYECLGHFPKNACLMEAHKHYRKAAENWTMIAKRILKAGDTQEPGYLEEAAAICRDTAMIEKAAMESLSLISG